MSPTPDHVISARPPSWWAIPLLLVTLCLWAGPAQAQSARALVERGNAAYAAGNFEEAKQAYEEAVAAEPDSPEIQYDLGNALYKLNDLPGAAKAYQQATAKGNPKVLSRSRFNLGNTSFRQGEAAEASDRQAASQLFAESVDHYQAAHDLDQTFAEAGRNLEVSKRRLLKVRQELKKEEETKAEQKRQQEAMAKELGEMADQQQGLADTNRDQQGQDAADQPGAGDQSAAQQALQEKTQAMRQKTGGSPEGQQAAEALEQAGQKQQEAQGQLAAQQPGEAAKAQDEAAAKLREAQQHLQGAPPQEDKPGEGKGQKAPEAQAKPETAASPSSSTDETKEEGAMPSEEAAEGAADKSVNQQAQDVLNEEKQNAVRRQAPGASGVQPVDKDW